MLQIIAITLFVRFIKLHLVKLIIKDILLDYNRML